MNSISQKMFKGLALSITACMLFGGQLLAQCNLTPFASNVCINGGSITLTGGTPLGGTYMGPGVTGGSFDPAAAGAGIHQIGYTTAVCSDTAYQNITVVNQTPASFSAIPGPFCSNSDSVLLTGGSPVPPPGSSLYFGPGVSSATGKFDPGIGGGPHNISYVYTDGNGCKDTAVASVTIHNVAPASFTGLDTAYCLEEPSPIALTPVPATGTFGPASLVTGTNFNVPTTPGPYQVYYFYTDGNGCTDSIIKNVRIRPKPAVSLTLPAPQKSKCDKDPAFALSTTSASPAGGTFSGTGIIASPIFDPATSGVGTFRITYTAQDVFGCENMDSSQFISVNPSPTVAFTLPFDSVCSNDPVFTLPNGTINGVSGPGTYSGSGVSPIPPPHTFNPALAGGGTHTITFTGTATNGCKNSTSRTIKVNPKPNVQFTNTIRKCANDSAFTLNVGIPLGGMYFGTGVLPDGITYDPQSTPGPDEYQLFYTYTDPKGCSDTNQQFITLDTFPVITITSFPVPAKICFGDTVELEASSDPANNVSFSWAPNLGDISPASATGDNIKAFPPQTKNITVTGIYNVNNCSSTSTIEVEVIPTAKAAVDGDLEICYGESTVLTASGATSYEWIEPGDKTAEITVTPVWDTTYSVVAYSDLDGNGKQCSTDTTFVKVIVNPLPIISAGLDTTAYIGDMITLQAQGAETYIWSGKEPELFSCLDCPNPMVKVMPEGGLSLQTIYYLAGTDENGCTNTDSIIVTLDEKVIVFVPTAFSPNLDGANDSLYVRTKGVKAINFQVFNRRGEEVFATKDITRGWDGTYKGAPLNKEVFVYYLTVTPYFKPSFKQTGSVTIVR